MMNFDLLLTVEPVLLLLLLCSYLELLLLLVFVMSAASWRL